MVKCNPLDPKYTWDSRVLTLVGGAVLYQNFIGMADPNLPETVNRYRYRRGGNQILACHFSDTVTSQPLVVCSDEQFKALPNRSDPSLAL